MHLHRGNVQRHTLLATHRQLTSISVTDGDPLVTQGTHLYKYDVIVFPVNCVYVVFLVVMFTEWSGCDAIFWVCVIYSTVIGFTEWAGRWRTMALHQRHRQSCSRRTLPQFRSHTTHLALTGRFPSNHWWGIDTWIHKHANLGTDYHWDHMHVEFKRFTYPILILNDVISYGRQSGPLTVICGSYGTALVGFEFTH